MPAPKPPGPKSPALPLVAISLVSAGAIGYEVLLIRLYAIGQWHHFAYMVISIALLGYGASGSFLALARGWLLARFLRAWQANAAFQATLPDFQPLLRHICKVGFEHHSAMSPAHVADAVLAMARLPLDANVQFMTLTATKMPYIGRG